MFELRDYQEEISGKAVDILKKYKIAYLQMEVRTGKTFTSLSTAQRYGAEKVLFITKKKAIQSILDDYKTGNYTFDFTVINNESIHKLKDKYDFLISDEHHRNGGFPKPSERTKLIKKMFSNLPIMFLSGTPNPESYSQIFHQYWISDYSPFKQYKNFYAWAKDFVNVTQKNYGYSNVNDYSDANYTKIEPLIKHLLFSYTKKQAGFVSTINETIIDVEMQPITYKIIKKLKDDKIVIGKESEIIADTAVKLQNKIHQLCSGSVILESGKSVVIDDSKAIAIKTLFIGKKIGIFYKFKAELDMIKNVFGDSVTTDLDEFNTTDKNIALQILAGREGLSLKKAVSLVYFNIDFSAISYFQSRDRMTTKDRTESNIFWIFAKDGIERKIYQSVKLKKDYTLRMFRKEYELSN
tara:strand:+ start:21695 stop:22924 length:1230 start_codon:yes stop_codon:yes gene_type:complete